MYVYFDAGVARGKCLGGAGDRLVTVGVQQANKVDGHYLYPKALMNRMYICSIPWSISEKRFD